MSTIALKVRVDGTDRAVKNIDELEKAINDLKQELRGTEIGSDNFRRLSGELQNAQSQLKTFNKEIEGLEPQQKSEAFLKLGEGIAGAFAIATTALNTFGVESEQVQEAQLAVTSALTIALGARQIAEAGLNLRIVANIISQRAYNLATAAGTTITRTFFATIAANPIGALVTVIAAAAAGIIALVNALEKQIDVQDEINKSLDEAALKTLEQETRLRSLQRVLNDNTQTQNVRNQALVELQKLLPELEGLELDNADAIDIVNDAINENIRLLRSRARTEALSQLAIQKTKEIIELQNSSLDSNLTFLNRVTIGLTNFTTKSIAAASVQTALNNRINQQRSLQEQLEEILNQYNDALDDNLALESEREKALKRTRDEEKRRLEIERQLKREEEERNRRIRDQIKALVDLRAQLIQVSSVDAPTPPVLTNLEASLERIKQSIEQAFPETLPQRFERLFNEPLQKIDEFGQLFIRLIPSLSRSFLANSEEFTNLYSTALDTLSARLRGGEITKEAFQAGVELVENYRILRDQLNREPELFRDVFDQQLFFQYFKDLKIATGDILTDIKLVDGEVVISQAQQIDGLEKGLSAAQNNLNQYIDNVVQTYVIFGLQNRQFIEESQKLGETQEEFAARLETEARNRISNIANLGQSIITTEQQVETFLQRSIELNQQLAELEPQARVAAFINSSTEIIKQANLELETRQRLLGIFKSDIEDFEEFRIRAEKEVAELIPQFEQLSADERLKILQDYYAKLKEQRDKNTQSEKLSTQEVVEGFSNGLRQISQVAQTGVQVFQQYVQTQLTALEETEKTILDRIVGDTEEAEAKRTEIREKYEAQRKQITKQGQLAQLQLTRLQAIANVAEAITKAFAEGPLVGQILAGVSAALGAIQVGVITSQISQVRNLRQGGLLFGPSHENGGIPLGNTGVFAEGGEVVINRQSSVQYRDLLSSINMAGGGRPIVSQPFDDSRLIEALTKTNREPIRAYVLEQEITDKQGINQRLQQLAKI